MLQQFTWQQFLVAALVLSLIWYIGVILIFYRRQLKTFLSRGRPDDPSKHDRNKSLPHRWEKGVEQVPQDQEDGVMGRAKLPEGMEIIETAGFGFAGDGAKDQQVGLVPDVMQEIKEVFRVLADQDGSKKDFFRLMEMVRKNYPKISSNPNIGGLNEFIAEHAPFHLSAEELENLWD